MENDINKDLTKIIDMSLSLVNELGYSLYNDNSDYDVYYGKEYKYDKLRITYYDRNYNSRNLYIFWGDTELLWYDFNRVQKSHFVDGKWKELIEAIYVSIPDVLKAKESANKNTKSIIQTMESLSTYFAYCIDCESNENLFDNIKLTLNDNGLDIQRQNYPTAVTNLSTGDNEYIDNYYYNIYYDRKIVAKFKDNSFNMFPNLEMLSKEFIPDEWIQLFKDSIMQAKLKNEVLMSKQIDTEATELLNKYKSTRL